MDFNFLEEYVIKKKILSDDVESDIYKEQNRDMSSINFAESPLKNLKSFELDTDFFTDMFTSIDAKSDPLELISRLLGAINIPKVVHKIENILQEIIDSGMFQSYKNYRLSLGILLSIHFLETVLEKVQSSNRSQKMIEVELAQSCYLFEESIEYFDIHNTLSSHFLSGPCLLKLEIDSIHYQDVASNGFYGILKRSEGRQGYNSILVPKIFSEYFSQFLRSKNSKIQVQICDKISSDTKEFGAVMHLGFSKLAIGLIGNDPQKIKSAFSGKVRNSELRKIKRNLPNYIDPSINKFFK